MKRKEHKNIGLKNNRLNPCPDSPNCVGSMYAQDQKHFMQAWKARDDQQNVMQHLIEVIEERRNAWIEKRSENYLHACFKIPVMGYIDDVEFYLPGNSGKIHFRSASRVGHADLGVNKRRMKKLKRRLGKKVDLD